MVSVEPVVAAFPSLAGVPEFPHQEDGVGPSSGWEKVPHHMASDPGNRLPFAGGCFVEVFPLCFGIQPPLVPFAPPFEHLLSPLFADLFAALLTVFLPLGYQEFIPEVAGDNYNPPSSVFPAPTGDPVPRWVAVQSVKGHPRTYGGTTDTTHRPTSIVGSSPHLREIHVASQQNCK